MDKQVIVSLKTTFDDLAHKDEETGVEFWYARELQPVLGYTEWRNFAGIIEKAKISCETSGSQYLCHFVDVNKMAPIGGGNVREVPDMMLTRYACYLIAQNGDPRKDEIAFAQSYFALQTRKQEMKRFFPKTSMSAAWTTKALGASAPQVTRLSSQNPL